MTYHHTVFTRNVLKVRLTCVKPSEKNREKIGKKVTVRGKKNKIGVEYIPLSTPACPRILDYITK